MDVAITCLTIAGTMTACAVICFLIYVHHQDKIVENHHARIKTLEEKVNWLTERALEEEDDYWRGGAPDGLGPDDFAGLDEPEF